MPNPNYDLERYESYNDVLIVEDNIGDVKLIDIYLEETDLFQCNLTHVYTLQDALTAIQENTYAAILLDLTLPDSSGMETITRVLEASRDANVIVLTGMEHRQLGLKAVSSGAQDFLVKGAFDADFLAKTLRFSIERTRVLKRLEEAQRIAHIGSWEYSQASDTFFASNEIYRILGYDPYKDQLTIDHLADAIGFKGRNIIDRIYLEAQIKDYVRRNLQITKADGSKRFITIRVKPTQIKDGKGVRGVMQDITDLQNIKGQLASSEERYRSIFNQSKDAIYVSNVDGKFIDFNESTIELFGYSREELLQLDVTKLYHNNEDRRNFILALERNKSIHNYQIDLITKEGISKTCILTSSFIETSDFVGYHGTIRDITDQLRARKLKREKELAEQSALLKEKLLANISHEMRTPMNAILGMSNLLLDTQLDLDQLTNVKTIKQSSENLLGIINDILEISSIQFGKINLQQKNFDLYELIENIIKVIGFRFHDKKIQFNHNIGPSVPQYVISDPLRINQVFLNIINNAMKFTNDGSVIVNFSSNVIDQNNSEVTCIVKDTGIGIPEDKLDAIFETFVRVSSDKEKLYEGTGLGLSIVQKILAFLKGSIKVDSVLGKGSTFTIKIPLEHGTTIKKEAAKTPFSTNTEEYPITILLVEDHKMNQLVARKTILKKWPNAEIDLAENGQIALDLLKEKDYEIILMDIQMPVLDGIETTRAIREQFTPPKSQTPILAMTAHAQLSETDKYKEYGMDYFVLKPFDPVQLFNAIEKYKR